MIAVGTLLDGKYEIISHLGTGGMGSVYRARHREMGNEVAIKVLHPRFAADPEGVKRFQREARIISTLRHKNVLSVYTFGAADDLVYIAMELVQGDSLLDKILAGGPVKPQEALPLLLQICDAMKYAHDNNVLHRDLKPGNVIIAQDADGVTEVKVVDFGLAKLLDGSEGQRLTKTGEVVGDPNYMSPEQVQGRALDRRSDIYNFGCLMYEVLSGAPPFPGDSAVAILYKHISEDPAPFAQEQSLPKSLEGITLTAMSKRPEHRYQTFDALSDVLKEYAANPALEVRPPKSSTTFMNRVPISFSRVAWLVVCSCLSLMIVLLANLPSRQPSVPLEEASTEELIRLGNVAFTHRDGNVALPYFLRALSKMDESPHASPIQRAMVETNIGTCYRMLGIEESALPHFLAAVKLHPASVDSNYRLADCYFDLHKWQEAAYWYAKAGNANGNPSGKLAMGTANFYSHHYERNDELPAEITDATATGTAATGTAATGTAATGTAATGTAATGTAGATATASGTAVTGAAGATATASGTAVTGAAGATATASGTAVTGAAGATATAIGARRWPGALELLSSVQDNDEATEMLSATLLRLRRYNEAEQVAKRIKKGSPAALAGSYRLATIYLAKGELKRARSILEKLFDDPGIRSVRVSLAKVEADLGLIDYQERNFSEAARHFDNAYQGLVLCRTSINPAENSDIWEFLLRTKHARDICLQRSK